MELKRIRCEADVEWAMQEIDRLLDVCGDNDESPEACMLEALTLMVEAWAQQHYPMALPDPIDYLDTYLQARQLDATALAPCLGGIENVESIMARQQPLSLDMIRQLVFQLGMPADVLIQPYEIQPPPPKAIPPSISGNPA